MEGGQFWKQKLKINAPGGWKWNFLRTRNKNNCFPGLTTTVSHYLEKTELYWYSCHQFSTLTVSVVSEAPFTRHHNINFLYEDIKRRHLEDPISLRLNVQHPSLKPRLRGYQKEAVRWMLHKEQYSDQIDNHGNGNEDEPMKDGKLVLIKFNGRKKL